MRGVSFRAPTSSDCLSEDRALHHTPLPQTGGVGLDGTHTLPSTLENRCRHDVTTATPTLPPSPSQ